MSETHVADWKFKEVDDLKGLLLEYPVVGIVDMTNIPARQLQKMRTLLREDVIIKMSRKSLMGHAIDKAAKEEKSLASLNEHLEGEQPAFVFAKMNPFKLYSILDKNRTNAPVKANAVAPTDIEVKKGDTGFPAGPILGDLQQAGIPAAIEKGKVVIKQDKVVAKEGEKVSSLLAVMLTRLGIEPMEIGLDMVAAYENGTVFLPDILSVDEDQVLRDIQTAYQSAFNLSVNTAYMTKTTAPTIIGKAAMEASALAVEATIFEPDVMDRIMSKAYSQMLSLAASLKDDAVDDDLRDKLTSKAQTPAAAPAAEEKAQEEKDEEPEEEEVSEEEAAAGLGALFG
jgi:large subunit ribosomal protein L10